MAAQILIVGSVNMDYVVEVERLPQPGETLTGSPLRLFAGGKGANQAVAAARLSAAKQSFVAVAGQVGEDEAGRILAGGLQKAGVDCTDLMVVPGSSGSAMILRDLAGQNSIVVSAGANSEWETERRETLRAAVERAQIVLLQMEIPVAINAQVAQWARAAGTMCILDPAPAQRISTQFLTNIDLLTPNESEACILVGERVREIVQEELPTMAERLLALGAKAVLLKLGKRGAYYRSVTEEVLVPSFDVTAIDTTAAGDTFNGALAVALREGRTMPEAMRFANAAAACSVTREGAQPSIPFRSEVDEFLRRHEVSQASG